MCLKSPRTLRLLLLLDIWGLTALPLQVRFTPF